MIKEKDRDQIYLEAITKWGAGSQLDMVLEECTELMKAILKYKRFLAGSDRIIEEAADVAIMIEQLIVIFRDFGSDRIFEDAQIKALDRLKERLQILGDGT